VTAEGLQVVDAHVHFWDPSVLRYPWLAELPALRRAFLPSDFAPLRSRSVDAVIFVEANCAPDQAALEVEWVERLAEEEPRIAGIVAFVDLLDEPRRGDALARLGRSSRVVGVRHNIQNQPRGFAIQPAFVRGVGDVGARGLPFDLCITADQLAEAVELVEQSPETRFVLDHCGKPAIRDDAFSEWAGQLERLAAHERVSCKLSGLLTESRPDQRDVRGLAPYLEHALACFGPTRVIYGSDWPVCVLGGGAEQWRAVVEETTAAWSESDRRALFAENAARFYRLPVAVDG
jgi:L-fuconolactonase